MEIEEKKGMKEAFSKLALHSKRVSLTALQVAQFALFL